MILHGNLKTFAYLLWLQVAFVKIRTGLAQCRINEEFRMCGPKCPMTCETLDTRLCCDVKCAEGCFCKDGFIIGPNMDCIPVKECPKPGTVQFVDSNLVVSEKAGTVRARVVRSDGMKGVVNFRWRARDMTATSGQDYLAPGGIVVMGDGQREAFIEITIIDDTAREPSESFTLELFQPSDKLLFGSKMSLLLTILDDDAKPGAFSLQPPSVRVSESVGTVDLTILREDGTDGQVTVFWKTSDLTANSGQDYIPVTGELVFSPGESRKIVSVRIIDDPHRETDENFRVSLYGPSGGATLGQQFVTTVTIVDNDRKPGRLAFERDVWTVSESAGSATFAITRTGGTDGEVQVHCTTFDKTAMAGSDYLPGHSIIAFKDGEARKIISVGIIDDSTKEGNEDFGIRLYEPSNGAVLGPVSSARVVITDNDRNPGTLEFKVTELRVQESSRKVVLEVIRTGGSDDFVRVRYGTADRTATKTTDYAETFGQLEFKDGVTQRSVEIIIQDDTVREDDERFVVEIFDPSGGAALGSRRTATVIIVDDDTRPGVVQFKKGTYTVGEKNGRVLLVVARTEGTDNEVSVKYKTLDGTAVSTQDYASVSNILIFGHGVSERTIEVRIMDDNEEERTERFTVELFDPRGGAVLGSIKTASVEIADDDEPQSVIQFRRRSGSVRESARVIRIPVTRQANLKRRVTVRWRTVPRTAKDGEDFQGGEGTLVFSPEESQQIITIPIIDDKKQENNEVFDVQLVDPSKNAKLGTPEKYTAEILDDDEDPAEFSFQDPHILVRESDGTAQLVVTRSSGKGTGSLQWRTSDGSAIANRHYRPAQGVLFFGAGDLKKTLQAAIIDNYQIDPSKNFRVELHTPSLGNIIRQGQAVVTILDDDEFFQFDPDSTSPSEDDTNKEKPSDLPVVQDDFAGIVMDCPPGQILKECATTCPPSCNTLEDPCGMSKGVIGCIRACFCPPGRVLDRDGGKRCVHPSECSKVAKAPKPEQIAFRSSSFVVPENDGFVEIPVVRGLAQDPANILWKVSDDSARYGVHYRAPSMVNKLSFDKGQKQKIIRIDLVDDNVTNPPRKFQVEIFTPFIGDIIAPSRNIATVTIQDNDDPLPSAPSQSNLSPLPDSGTLVLSHPQPGDGLPGLGTLTPEKEITAGSLRPSQERPGSPADVSTPSRPSVAGIPSSSHPAVPFPGWRPGKEPGSGSAAPSPVSQLQQTAGTPSQPGGFLPSGPTAPTAISPNERPFGTLSPAGMPGIPGSSNFPGTSFTSGRPSLPSTSLTPGGVPSFPALPSSSGFSPGGHIPSSSPTGLSSLVPDGTSVPGAPSISSPSGNVGGPSLPRDPSMPSSGGSVGRPSMPSSGGSVGRPSFPRDPTMPSSGGSAGRPSFSRDPTMPSSGGSVGRPSVLGDPSVPSSGGSVGRPSMPSSGGSVGRPSMPSSGGSVGRPSTLGDPSMPSSGGSAGRPSFSRDPTMPSSGGSVGRPSVLGDPSVPSSGGSVGRPSFPRDPTMPSSGGSVGRPSFSRDPTMPSSGGSVGRPSVLGDPSVPSSGGSVGRPSMPSSGGSVGRPSMPSSGGSVGRPSHPGDPSMPSSGGSAGRPSFSRDPTMPSSGGSVGRPSVLGDPSVPSSGGSVGRPSMPSSGGSVGRPSMPSSGGSVGRPSILGDPSMPSSGGSVGRPSLPRDPSMPSSGGSVGRPSFPRDPTMPSSGGSVGRPSILGDPSVPSSGGSVGRPSIPGDPSMPSSGGSVGRPSILGDPTMPSSGGSVGRPSFPGDPSVPSSSGSASRPSLPGVSSSLSPGGKFPESPLPAGSLPHVTNTAGSQLPSFPDAVSPGENISPSVSSVRPDGSVSGFPLPSSGSPSSPVSPIPSILSDADSVLPEVPSVLSTGSSSLPVVSSVLSGGGGSVSSLPVVSSISSGSGGSVSYLPVVSSVLSSGGDSSAGSLPVVSSVLSNSGGSSLGSPVPIVSSVLSSGGSESVASILGSGGILSGASSLTGGLSLTSSVRGSSQGSGSSLAHSGTSFGSSAEGSFQVHAGFSPIVTACPRGMTLKECARSCPPTCDDWKFSKPCGVNGPGPSTGGFGCVRACFCPQGLVLDRADGTKCVRPSQCGCPRGMSRVDCMPSCVPTCQNRACPRQRSGGLLGGLGGLLGGGSARKCSPGCQCPPGTVLRRAGDVTCVPAYMC